MQQIAQALEAIYFLVASIALIVGGGWAYLKYIRHRILKERLNTGVEGRVEESGDVLRLVVECEAENAGVREFDIGREGTTVRLYARTLDTVATDKAREASWEPMGTWRAFQERPLVEPGERIADTKLIELPKSGFGALLLELNTYSESSGQPWISREVVPLRGRVDNLDDEEVS